MKESLSVLGIRMEYMTLDDAQNLIEEYLEDDVLNTMCVVTKEMLVYAGDHPEYKEVLESMDVHVMGGGDIFKAAGITEETLLKSADEQTIWRTFTETVMRENRSCFLLVSDENELQYILENIRGEAPDLHLIGTYAAENAQGDPEVIVNEINSVLPDVIISSMEQPEQEIFVHEHRKKIGAKVWFGLPPYHKGERDSWFSRFVEKAVFNRRVHKYNNLQEEE